MFNPLGLRAELRPVHNLNDTSVHASYVEWAQRRIDNDKSRSTRGSPTIREQGG
ncbi:MAG: hypothetical protein U0V73_04365 [Acidimicrobiia bacterium]